MDTGDRKSVHHAALYVPVPLVVRFLRYTGRFVRSTLHRVQAVRACTSACTVGTDAARRWWVSVAARWWASAPRAMPLMRSR